MVERQFYTLLVVGSNPSSCIFTIHLPDTPPNDDGKQDAYGPENVQPIRLQHGRRNVKERAVFEERPGSGIVGMRGQSDRALGEMMRRGYAALCREPACHTGAASLQPDRGGSNGPDPKAEPSPGMERFSW